ncbi:Thiopurine S-methyltransferase [Pandoraea terrigena]|uniref:Thiopurine S-methyltransferase n=1 Tax=Pandoraea terrigena TaxID=2508292 RepID=A0A5E4SHI1_9BURK|nr:Thiopurine S-methyltransferase [Pandoraea terrigena]
MSIVQQSHVAFAAPRDDDRPETGGAPTVPTVPSFSHRDPSRAEFWDERFANAFMPWDAAGVPNALRDFVAGEGVPRATLIPGCGSAYEAAWLDAQGWPVRAIDFSATAVASAKARLGRQAALVEQADFFTYAPPFALEVIYERAFLCALPRTLWQDYARRMAQLLPQGGRLAGLFFLRETHKGPPFGIAPDALDALLRDDFVCEADRLVDDSVPVFAGAEHWMIWRRR